MRMRLGFLAGAAVGYVLGTRAGRQQFDKIKEKAQEVWENPKVQESVHKAQETATDFVKEKAPELRDKLGGGSHGDAPDDLGTFTTAGSDETEQRGSSATGSSGSTYPTGSNGNRA